MSLSSEINNDKTQNYLNVQKEARRLKQNYCENADPILQRNVNIKGPALRKTNTNVIKQGDMIDRPKKKIIPQRSCAIFNQSNDSSVTDGSFQKNRKKYLAGDFETRKHEDKYKMYQAYNTEPTFNQIDAIFDQKIPVCRERDHVKLVNNNKPTEEYTKMQNRKSNMMMGSSRKVDIKENPNPLLHNQIHPSYLSERNHIKKCLGNQSESCMGIVLNQDNMPCQGLNCTVKPNLIDPQVLRQSYQLNRDALNRKWNKD